MFFCPGSCANQSCSFSFQPSACALLGGQISLAIPCAGLQLTSAYCCHPSALLWQHSSPILISFLNHMIRITSPPQHLDEGFAPCWEETTERPGACLRVTVSLYPSGWAGCGQNEKGLMPFLRDGGHTHGLWAASLWKRGLRRPTHGIQGKGAGATKRNSAVSLVYCFKSVRRLFISVSSDSILRQCI